ncbi:MAG: isoprenylcysteine carboxylmethyltransferase family protein [Paracoccaceae bacterium]
MPAVDRPDIVIFPPLAMLIAIVAAVALEWLLPLQILPPPFQFWMTVIGALLFFASLAVAVSGARTFAKYGTNVDVRHPALKVVETGPYRFTRNPMYLGMVVGQFGLAMAFSLDWALIGGVALWAVLHYGVVLREETYLTAKFGATYTAFKSRTHRWL